MKLITLSKLIIDNLQLTIGRLFFLIILSFFFYSPAGAPDTLWTKTYGGTHQDEGHSVQVTNDGGFIITGLTRSFSTNDEYDVYLIRTNSNGDTLWTKIYGGSSYDLGYSIQQTSDSGFIIAGATSSFGAQGTDLFLVRTDHNGDTLWTKMYGGASDDYAYSIQKTNDGGFIIVGTTYSFGAGETDIYLVRTDSKGDTLWTRSYGGAEEDNGHSVLQMKDGAFIIVGRTRSFGSGIDDIYLIRTNPNGGTLWTKTYGGSDRDYGYSVLQENDGFIIAGWSHSYGVGKQNVYVIRTDLNGDTLWTKTYGGLESNEGYSLQHTSDGGFIVVGNTSSFDTTGGMDVYLIRTDSNGDTLWTKAVGGTHNDYGYSVQQTSDGGFIIAGKTQSFGAGQEDVYLIRLDKDSTAIQQEIPFNYIKPNNFIVSYDHGNISIRYNIPYSTSVKLEAYDIKGKLVKVITDKFMQKGSYSVNWDSKRFGAGVYYIKLSSNGSAVSKKFTIIK